MNNWRSTWKKRQFLTLVSSFFAIILQNNRITTYQAWDSLVNYSAVNLINFFFGKTAIQTFHICTVKTQYQCLFHDNSKGDATVSWDSSCKNPVF